MIPEFNGDFTQWLRGFWLSAQSGNMTTASEVAQRTQSAISHQIKSLEDEYGVKLFERRKGRKLELTDSGKLLLEKTVKIFDIINSVKDSIGVLPARLSGKITIVTTYTIVQYFLPQKLALFQQYYPNVEFQIRGEAALEPILEQLQRGKVDMGILCTEENHQEFRMTPLFSTHVALLSPKTGPYALSHLPSLELIGHIPYIAPPHNSSMELFVARHLERRNVFMRDTHMVSYHEAAKVYTRLGLGITFLDDFACTAKDREELNLISMSAYFPNREYVAALLRGNEPSMALEAFIRFLSKGESILPNNLPPTQKSEPTAAPPEDINSLAAPSKLNDADYDPWH